MSKLTDGATEHGLMPSVPHPKTLEEGARRERPRRERSRKERSRKERSRKERSRKERQGLTTRSEVAVYSGSFDPITLGHRSVVERALPLFSKVVCLVAVHPTKQPLFSGPERVALIEEALGDLPGVEVAYTRGYTVDFARSVGARYLLRGIRNQTDASYETELASLNHGLAPEISTWFLSADPSLSEISSSELKCRAERDEALDAWCAGCVARALRKLR